MLLLTREDVLIHSIQDIILIETEIEQASTIAIDQVANRRFGDLLDECAITSVFRVTRLQQILPQLGGTDDCHIHQSSPMPIHPTQAIHVESSRAALDLGVLVTIRRILASGQRLYADAAVHAMRWDRDDIGRPLGTSINELTTLLTQFEDLDAELAAAITPRSTNDDTTSQAKQAD